MIVLKLALIFILVMVIISRKQPIYTAVSIGALLTWLLYGISLKDGFSAILTGALSKSTLSLIVVMYIVTFLQKMMEQRGAIYRAQKGLSALFNNRWVNCAAAPTFIGMLPTPNAAFIAGDIVKASAGEYLTHEEMAVTTTYFRHVSESFMPTYTAILTALTLAGIAAGDFVVAMLPIVAVIIASGCFWFLRGKVPMSTGEQPSKNKGADLLEILKGLWPIITVILIVIFLGWEVYQAAALILVCYFFVHKFNFEEIKPYFRSSFQEKLVFNTFAVMIFKEFLTASGAINALPDFFAQLPIPTFLVFVLIFLFGTIVSGSTAIIVLCLPVAMASVPAAGLPLLVLLMGVIYAASQMSPTHICLALTAEYFGISLGTLVRKSIPPIMTTVAFAILYYVVWTGFFI